MAIKKSPKDDEKEKPDIEVEREEPKDEEKVVELEVASDGKEEEDDADGEDEETPKLSRGEKKRAWQRAKEEADQARSEAARYRQHAMELEARQNAYFANQQQGQYYQNLKAEEDRLYEEQEMMYAAFQQAGGDRAPKEVLDKFGQKARELEGRKYDLAARRNGAGQQQASPQQIAQIAQLDRLKEKYRDILENQQAYAWAHGRRMQLIYQDGEADTEALGDIVAEETRRRFGLNGHGHAPQRRRPPPDESTKARYSGVPSRGSPVASGAVTVRIDRAARSLAKAAFPDLSEEKAIQKWARGPGRRAALANAAKSR